MPLLYTKTIRNGWLGIWKIDETREELLELYTPLDEEKKRYNLIAGELKKKQWLAVRILLNTQIPRAEIYYDEFNKPFLRNSPAHISVSHTSNYAAIIIDQKNPVGIDIEVSSDRILAIAKKFMSEGEMNSISESNRASHLTLFWCAKEAVYKLHGKKGLLFREQILVEPFVYAQSGKIRVNLTKENLNKFYKLCYESINENKLVYTLNE